jgi:hypothetical protein
MHSPAASLEAKALAQLRSTSKAGRLSAPRALGPMAPVTSQGVRLAAAQTTGVASERTPAKWTIAALNKSFMVRLPLGCNGGRFAAPARKLQDLRLFDDGGGGY